MDHTYITIGGAEHEATEWFAMIDKRGKYEIWIYDKKRTGSTMSPFCAKYKPPSTLTGSRHSWNPFARNTNPRGEGSSTGTGEGSSDQRSDDMKELDKKLCDHFYKEFLYEQLPGPRHKAHSPALDEMKQERRFPEYQMSVDNAATYIREWDTKPEDVKKEIVLVSLGSVQAIRKRVAQEQATNVYQSSSSSATDPYTSL
ncbi:hypothetical protein CI109_105372 [Kwoniella shandongensis]|uniref:Uncharacterized protein n=1 Tax=Kwoniella shandongensis TaxID=1734106 RepID=A0AAJ8LPL0_9TREE